MKKLGFGPGAISGTFFRFSPGHRKARLDLAGLAGCWLFVACARIARPNDSLPLAELKIRRNKIAIIYRE